MVSADKLKKDFNNYTLSEIEKLSPKEVDENIERLVLKLFQNIHHGKCNYIYDDDLSELETVKAEFDKFVELADNKFTNLGNSVNFRKYTYIYNALKTANISILNHELSEKNRLRDDVVKFITVEFELLNFALNMIYDNYSNYRMLNKLFNDLSMVDNLDITFEIVEKYLNSPEYVVNNKLVDDLNSMVRTSIKVLLNLINELERVVDVDIVDDGSYFDDAVENMKTELKNSFSNENKFKTESLKQNGYDDVLFDNVEIVKDEIKIVESFIKVKNDFFKLYDGNNGFADLSAESFEWYKEFNSERYSDFDEFMKSEPKYDLKKCELILPETKNIAY